MVSPGRHRGGRNTRGETRDTGSRPVPDCSGHPGGVSSPKNALREEEWGVPTGCVTRLLQGTCQGPTCPGDPGPLARSEWLWGMKQRAQWPCRRPPLAAQPPGLPQPLPCSREGLSRRPDFPQPVPPVPFLGAGKTLCFPFGRLPRASRERAGSTLLRFLRRSTQSPGTPGQKEVGGRDGAPGEQEAMAPDPGWAGFLFTAGPVRVRSEAFSFPSPDDPEGAFVPPEFDVTGNTFEVGGSSRAPQPSPGCRRGRHGEGRYGGGSSVQGAGWGRGRLRSTPLCQSQGPRRQLGVWTRLSLLLLSVFPACELDYV